MTTLKKHLRNLFNNPTIYIGILVLLFGISFLIRLDNFFLEPLGRSYFDFYFQRWTNTEVFLHISYVFQVYGLESISEHLFLSYQGGGLIYPSFSPALFVVPNIIARILKIVPDSRFLQCFSLSLQFLSCIISFYLIQELIKKIVKIKWQQNTIALLISLVYLFNTNSLESHLNVYWAHQLAQPFYFLLLYFFVKARGMIKIFPLVILSFLLPYIFWTGFYINAAFFVYFLISYLKNKTNKEYLTRTIIIIVTSIVSLGANVGHFLLKISWSEYLHLITTRASARSVFFKNQYDDIGFKLLQSLMVDFGFYAFIAFITLIFFITIKRKSIKKKLSKYCFELALIGITLFPLVESIILVEHDFVYNFGRLKFLVPLMLILALLIAKTVQKKAISIWIFVIAILMASLGHTLIYLQIHNPSHYVLYYDGPLMEPYDRYLHMIYEARYKL